MKYYDKNPHDEDITRDEETRAMEELIRGRVGTGNPFKVPEGYFDHLPDLLMDKIDSEEAKADDSRERGRTMTWLGSHRKRMWWAAACVIAAVMTIGFQAGFTKDTVGKASDGIASVKDAHKQEPVRSTQTGTRHALDGMQQHITTICNDAYVDEVADYAMMDNADIIACLDE